MQNFTILRSERRHEGKVFDLVVDEIEYSAGRRAVREIAVHPGGAVVVAMTDDATLLLVRQYRYPVKRELYELPAGKLGPGEDPFVCAVRELEEETGYVAEEWKKLGAIYTTPGFCTEVLHVYLATGVKPTGRGQQLEEGERGLTVELFPLERVVRMIEDGTINDGKTICGIFLTLRMLKRIVEVNDE